MSSLASTVQPKTGPEAAQQSADIRLADVTKEFDDVVAVDGISLTMEAGRFFALLGPSGCGKTTTLRMIGGFEDPSSGSIYLGDTDVVGLPPYKRNVNTVFQSYALFPHLTIFENVAFGMFCISYVVVTVKARLISFDRSLEEAAMDLGANEFTTFRKVTLPLIAPAILSGLLLSFALSVDDFVVTYFNAGSEVTFPLFVWGAAQRGVPPQVNVMGTVIFVVALGLMLLNVLLQRRREGVPA